MENGPVTDSFISRADLTIDERKDYIQAVQCLMKLPPKAQEQVPGVLNRYDDFVATHVTGIPVLHAPVGNLPRAHQDPGISANAGIDEPFR